MSNIFKKLSVNLKNFEDKKQLQEELYKKIIDTQSTLTRKYFDENLSSDFEKLSKIFREVRMGEVKLSIGVELFEEELSIRLKNPEYTTTYQISLFFTSDYPDEDDKLEKLKKYKITNDNMCFSVSWCNTYYSTNESRPNEKKFTLKKKEKAYEYFNDLFKSKILILEDLSR